METSVERPGESEGTGVTSELYTVYNQPSNNTQKPRARLWRSK